MQIDFIEVSNYRKLLAARIDIAKTQTLFVGANNSGKTSAMVALRQFLKDRGGFTTKDITALNWAKLEALAESWMVLGEEEAPDAEAFNRLMPTLDVWITAADHELHHVAHLIPSLDWTSGQLGVRLRLEASNFEALVADFREAKSAADAHIQKYAKENVAPAKDFSLWPKSFADYLDRRFSQTRQAYLLDPAKVAAPCGVHRAQPQDLPPDPVPLDRDPFDGLIHMREIAAQRGFADATDAARNDGEEKEIASPGGSRHRLSSQLQAYYRRHLDPNKAPTEEDVSALGAFHTAQSTFDERLEKGFSAAKTELESLGYPGMSNPKLSISTRIKPTDGLNHPSAVQYDIGGDGDAIRLPEDYSGLGFQNLISMVFRLMRFRDEWMRVGKLSASSGGDSDAAIEPLQLILVEEPEAHLHAQVQQVFIRKAYDVLRNHGLLGKGTDFQTQLIVSTHSSHVAHEVDFANLRYFKRRPAETGGVPTSVVANLTSLFGDNDETTRFVRRYLKTTHCDLFFADGVILLEGAAERILVPHFIRHHHHELAARYISLLEVGGSHAHRLKPLIDVLSIPTLIVSDLDAMDPSNQNRPARPEMGKGYETGNTVIKTWVPAKIDVDDLLQEAAVPEKAGTGFGVVGVVYQRAIDVTYPDGTAQKTIIPSTFEDALALSNPSLIGALKGEAMTNKFAKMVTDGTDADAIAQGLYDRLRDRPQKAAFALDVLSSDQFEKFAPPTYISDGLKWLEGQLKQSAASPL
ncbi:MAG: ATP-dependent endonuclease [Henriciella sp.]|jgi:predicted ATP-dependent endonuclease of OLD family|nr:AAA family ATPase [Henriciella sp.]MAO81277.1 ATP-dependent endonuclease [Nocardioides sp.]MBK74357.1 ATP-dependent endonuclease [Henriciella sp.]|tara:strand:+ start:2021 stop:4273 length:2253 start_codon:yes stop_codon:yes gene_type:complete